MQYRTEFELSLEEYNVEPASVKLVIWDPFFTWLRGTPLPPAKEPDESTEAYIARCGSCPTDVEWVHTPLVNGAGTVPRYTPRAAADFFIGTQNHVPGEMGFVARAVG